MNRDGMSRIGRQDTSYRLRVAMDSRLPKPDQMQLTAPVIVELFDGREVILQAGFVTDCHSTPLWLASLLPEYDNRTNIAAIVHDYLYMNWEEFFDCNSDLAVCTSQYPAYARDYADCAYRELMNRFHPSGWRNGLYYRAVRWLGGYNWRKFRRLNQNKVNP